jgi:hypothetical protein
VFLQARRRGRSQQESRKDGLSVVLEGPLRNSPAALGTSHSRDNTEAAALSRPQHLRPQAARAQVKPKVGGSEGRALMSNNLAEFHLLAGLPVKRRVDGKEGRVLMANLAAPRAAGPRLVPTVDRGDQKAERKKARSPLRLPALDNKKLKIDAPSWNDPGPRCVQRWSL